MNNYQVKEKTFVKSPNSYNLIMKRYTYSLMAVFVLLILSYFIFDMSEEIIPLLKSFAISLAFASILQYLINLFKKDQKFIHIYHNDHIHLIAIIISFFGAKVNIPVLLGAILLSVTFKNILKNANISVALYGIIVIMLYQYFTNSIVTCDVLKAINPNTIISCLSLLAFIYLFIKKSIKYSVVLSYLITFIVLVFLYGIIKKHDAILFLNELSMQNAIFLTIYTLTDYKASPTLNECQILYGIAIGIIASILTIFLPVMPSVISFIIGSLCLTNIFENLSLKIKHY